jgi:hypothetical protein
MIGEAARVGKMLANAAARVIHGVTSRFVRQTTILWT